MKNVFYVFLLFYVTILAQTKRPNFVIFMADDLGYGDLECYGNTNVKTPHLNQLAKEGILFTDFHSNGAVCSPTRAALLTGKYQQRTGIDGVVTAKSHRHFGLSLEELTFAEAFKKEGYITGMFGKWHLGYDPKFNPTKQGFDEFIGFVSGNVDYHSHVDQEGYEDWWMQNELKKEEGYTTDIISKHTIAFLNKHKKDNFVLYIPHEAPHFPIQDRDSKAYRVIGEVPIKKHGAKSKPMYNKMIEIMDEAMGEMIRTLRDLKLDQNTIVLFVSDNGGATLGTNKPLKGHKGMVAEGGHRVPAIAWCPGIVAQGVKNDTPLMTMDIFPTLLDFIGKKTDPKSIDGVSFKNVLTKNEALNERDLFWEHKKQIAIRSGKWKLSKGNANGAPSLFDMSNDISEKNNVASKHPEIVKLLETKIKEWKADVKNGVPSMYGSEKETKRKKKSKKTKK